MPIMTSSLVNILVSNLVKNWRILLEQSFTAHLSLMSTLFIQYRAVQETLAVNHSCRNYFKSHKGIYQLPYNTTIPPLTCALGLHLIQTCMLVRYIYLCNYLRYRDSVNNTVEANSSVFYLIRMLWMQSVRACRQ